MSLGKVRNQDCECQCVEELARQLKRKKGADVVIYERNGDTATGSIKDVVNNSVLILGRLQGGFEAQKRNCACGTGPTLVIMRFDEIMISVCEILEFGVLSKDQLAETLKSSNKTN